MLLSKFQPSVHSYRPLIQLKIFTMGLSYFLVKIIVTFQLESSFKFMML